MKELLAVFETSILTIRKHWFPLIIITFLTEGVVLFARTKWSYFLDFQEFSAFGSLAGIVKGVLDFMAISVLTPIGKSATAYLIDTNETTWISGFSAYWAAIKKLPQILIAGLMWFFGAFVGLLFLLVPGIIFFFGSQFVIQVLLVENVSIFEAFKRSWKLAKINIWAVIGLFLIVEITQGILGDLLKTLIEKRVPVFPEYAADWFVSTFMALIVYVPIAVLYLIRKDFNTDK